MSRLPDLLQNGNTTQIAPHLRPWREMAVIASMVMELSWITVWFLLFINREGRILYWRALVVFGFMMVSSYLLSRILVQLNVRIITQRIWMSLMILVFILIGLRTLGNDSEPVGLLALLNRPVRSFQDAINLFPVEFILMISVLLVCWRGFYRVGRLVGSMEIVQGFQAGTLMLLLYGIISNWSQAVIGGELYLFVFSGLLAMSAARISVSSYLLGGQRIPFSIRWIAGIAFVALLISVLAAQLLNLADGEGPNILRSVLSWIIYILALLLSPLMFLVIQIVTYLGRWLNLGGLLQNLVEISQQFQLLIDRLVEGIQQWTARFQLGFLDVWIDKLTITRPIILWSVVILFVVILLVMVRSQIIKDRMEQDAEYESISGQENLLESLRDILRSGLDRMADRLEQMRGLRNARRLLAAARVRRIYVHLLDLSTKLENPRPSSFTPLEFLPSLERLFPGFKGELELITEAYLRVRYGDLPENKDEVFAIDAAWRKVAATGQEMVKAQKKRKI